MTWRGMCARPYSEGLGRRWGGGNRIKEWQAVSALERLGLARDASHLDVAREAGAYTRPLFSPT
jgi:hypothetical protein